MRQGIIVTCFLGLFVAGAMLFTGGESLFSVPDAPVRAVATAIAEAASPAAERPVGRIAARAPPSASGRRTHWPCFTGFPRGFGQVDFGKDHGAGQGLTVVAKRILTRPVDHYVPFGGRPSSAVAESGATLMSLAEPYAVPAGKAAFTEIGPPSEEPAQASPRADDEAAEDRADFERFSIAAAGGDLNAEYRLGILYRDGRGIDRDPATAAHWLLVSAKGGNPLAAIAIAEMYDAGVGVARDPAAAYAWLDLAAARCPDRLRPRLRPEGARPRRGRPDTGGTRPGPPSASERSRSRGRSVIS